MAGATMLDSRDRVPVPPPEPSVAKQLAHPPEVTLAFDGDPSRFAARAPGVSHAEIAALRRGGVHVDDTLDLHGDTAKTGTERLRRWLAESVRLGRRCVRVVHGKGTHSELGATLREAVMSELVGPLSGYVHAFATAAPADGGEGATLILLRARVGR
jgi:DNA-nicking Smr family endonuclease